MKTNVIKKIAYNSNPISVQTSQDLGSESSFTFRYITHSSIAYPISNDQIGNAVREHRVLVPFAGLPKGLPNAKNTRESNITVALCKDVKEGVISPDQSGVTPGAFYLRNSGITIIADSVDVDPGTNTLRVKMSGEKSSIIDGGHTYKIIRSIIEDYDNGDIPYIPNEYVSVTIFTGTNSLLTPEISQGKNSHMKQMQLSLVNQRQKLDFLKKALDGRPGLPNYSEMISWYQNQNITDQVQYPIDGSMILKILTAVDIVKWPTDQIKVTHPIKSYLSARDGIVEHFQDNENNYLLLSEVALDICRLHNLLIVKAPQWVEKNGPSMEKIFDSGKKKSKELIFLSGTLKQELVLAEKILFAGFAYPMLAAFRQFLEVVNADGVSTIRWKEGYSFSQITIMLEDGLGDYLVKEAHNALLAKGEVMNAACKDSAIWTNMFNLVERFARNYNN